jgi:hypothetical protein
MNSKKVDNGRIDTLYSDNYNIYNLFEEPPIGQINFNEEAIKGVHLNNDISRVFFSMDNINALQDAIRYQVYIKTCKKHIIDRQSDTELKVIIRATYLEHALHASRDTLAEIKRLNLIVIDFCVTRILQEINIYLRYKNDISNLPIPILRGEFVSTKGTKVLELKDF